jgi:cyclophilin family peptidyl-prolyl cis-trans isomerase
VSLRHLAVVNCWKLLSALNLTLLLAVAGCGRGDKNASPEASIGGSAANSASSGAADGQAGSKPLADPKHPVVVMETTAGNITIQLDAEKAPETVDNFLQYVKRNHYDQTIVHQVYKGQGFLCGGYGVNLLEKPGRTPIFSEAARADAAKNLRGTISMVRAPDAKDSATCQFFVNLTDNPALDHRDETPEGYGYCVFGTVTDGMDVVDAIGSAPVHDTPGLDHTPVQMITVNSSRRIR